MRRFPDLIGRYLGQATTEYLMMLLFVVSLFFLIFKGPVGKALSHLEGSLNQRITQMFTGENMYHLPFSR